MLNGDKANHYWGLRFFLNLEAILVDEAHSVCSRVAYWARGTETSD